MPTLQTAGLGGRPAGLLTFGLGPFAGAGGGVAPTTPGVYRDDAVMEDAGARLVALGLFDAVEVGAVPDEEPMGAARQYAVAWVWDDGAENAPIFPGGSWTERIGRFGVAIEVKHADPLERRRRMARLEQEVMNALQGKKLAGATYPGSVRVQRDGRDYRVNHPFLRSVLIGRYRFPVGGTAAGDVRDRESVWN
jgi:hypothetical protein